MRRLLRLCGALASATALCLALSSTALFSSSAAPLPATIIVNSTSDAAANDGLCTLREAITSANSEAASGAASGECAAGSGTDAITISVTGTINLTGALPNLASAMTIGGPGAGQLTVRRDTGGDYRIFTVNSGVAVNISGLTVANGKTPDAAAGVNGGNAGGGGGISNAGTLSLTGVTVSGNRTGAGAGTGIGGVGGGISNTGTLPLTGSTVSGNTSGACNTGTGTPGYAGGIENGTNLTVSGSTISGNTGFAAGAILNRSALSLTNTTVSGNNVYSFGSAVNNDTSATLTLTNCTVAANSVSGVDSVSGVNNFGPAANAVVRNTLIAGNGGADDGDAVGHFTSQGHNLVGVFPNDISSSGFNAPGDQTGTMGSPLNARLGPLADNGGLTLTHALLPGSPALEAGDNALAKDADNNALTTDQRGAGFPRIADAADADTTQTVDIRAFEAHPSVEDISNQATNEDAPLSFSFNVGDAALGISSVTASSGNATLFPNDTSHVSVTGSGSTRTLTLTPATNLSGLATIAVTVTGTNGRSASDAFQVTVTAVNDAPVNTVPGSQPTVQHTPVVFSAANSNAISVADVDAGSDAVKVTLTGTSGTVTLGSTAGLTFITGDGTDDPVSSFTGTLSAINAALDGLTFKPAHGFGGAAGLQIVTDDLGHNGSGGALTDTDGVTIDVAPGGTLAFGASAYEVNETGTSVAVTVTRGGGSAGAASVNYATSGVTATGGATCAAGVDYISASGTLNWADGENAAKTFTITLCEDFGDVGDETLSISLSGATGSATVGAPAMTTLTIKDYNPAGGVLQFSQNGYSVAEGVAALTVTVLRSGHAVTEATVDYATDDGSTPAVFVPCSSTTGLALDRCDYAKALGTLRFAAGEREKTFQVLVSDDSYTEGSETAQLKLSNPTGGAELGKLAAVVMTITDDSPESAGNPIDDATKFVTQHYHDFLNRDPDAEGLAFWVGGIEGCGADAGCREVKRIDTSAAFFLSIEFQNTGYLVERTYKTAFGDATSPGVPGTVPVVRLDEFLRDTQRIGRDVIVNQGDWEARLAANKGAYALEFIQRQRFHAAFPDTMTAAEFVGKLDENAGGVLSADERAQLTALLAPEPPDPTRRAAVLRQVAEDQTLVERERNRAFVLMQYFGYLRRNPDDAPEKDLNFAGWRFWLSKLEEFDGDYRRAEMVKAFLNSDEYRRRFGQQ